LTRAGIARRALLVHGFYALGVPSPPAAAHVFEITEVHVALDERGTYRAEITLDVDALALGVSPTSDSARNAAELQAMSPAELESAADRARQTLERRVRIRFDGEKQRPTVEFPGRDAPEANPEFETVLGTVARLTGDIPHGAAELTVGLSRAFGPVRLTIVDRSSTEPDRYTLVPGEDSPPHFIGLSSAPRTPVIVAAGYLVLGFEHIVPGGFDHVLFVVGLRWT
jgi:hypothetical protein